MWLVNDYTMRFRGNVLLPRAGLGGSRRGLARPGGETHPSVQRRNAFQRPSSTLLGLGVCQDL
jgi:hypothetical protein